MKLYYLFIIILSVIFIVSCDNSETKNLIPDGKQNIEQNEVSVLKFTSPSSDVKYRIGDEITIKAELTDSLKKPDSVSISYNGGILVTLKNYPFVYKWKTNDTVIKTGRQKLISTISLKDGRKQSAEISFLVLSDIKPVEYKYQLKKKFHHDPEAYTQGLFFDGGFLYEGTGEYGTSSLRKTKIQTGEILKSVNLPGEIFGEGICLFKNKIVQLSWRSNTAFIYDKESFKQIGKFNYSTEGWGITTDGKQLIMSDGSAKLYFLDPETYTQTSFLEVCDYYGQVLYLNELEYIKGEIWANVYQENYIIAINPVNGKVTKKINLEGILDPKDVNQKVDVLNGIAWNPQNNSIFVTGKWWPYIYEIDIIR